MSGSSTVRSVPKTVLETTKANIGSLQIGHGTNLALVQGVRQQQTLTPTCKVRWSFRRLQDMYGVFDALAQLCFALKVCQALQWLSYASEPTAPRALDIHTYMGYTMWPAMPCGSHLT